MLYKYMDNFQACEMSHEFCSTVYRLYFHLD